MRSVLAAFVIALAVACLLTPLVRRFALRVGAVAEPNGRTVHTRIVPRLGGVAICIAVLVPVAALLFIENGMARLFQSQIPRVVGLIVGGVAMCAVGFVDDTRGLRMRHKLGAQVLVACGAFAAGFRIMAVRLPIFGDLSMGIFALPVTVLWFVGIINALNLIDGLDGLAAGVAFFAGITNLAVAMISHSGFVELIMAALLGALLGFLLYNFNPARIFMGDSGSYFLGFVLAAASINGAGQKVSTAVGMLVPVVALGVPIFDTLFAMIRRALERRPMFAPDRGHIHHRLLKMGITHRRAVLLIYALSAVFTVAAISIYVGCNWQIGLALAAASATLLGFVRFVGLFSNLHLRHRDRARIRSQETERLRRALPGLPARLARARREADLLEVLGELGAEAGLAAVDIVPRDHLGSVHAAWSDGNGQCRRLVAVSIHPLGSESLARATLRVAATNDFEDSEMPPQTEILLQVVADMMAAHLQRVGSALGPRVPEPFVREERARSAQAMGAAQPSG